MVLRPETWPARENLLILSAFRLAGRQRVELRGGLLRVCAVVSASSWVVEKLPTAVVVSPASCVAVIALACVVEKACTSVELSASIWAAVSEPDLGRRQLRHLRSVNASPTAVVLRPDYLRRGQFRRLSSAVLGWPASSALSCVVVSGRAASSCNAVKLRGREVAPAPSSSGPLAASQSGHPPGCRRERLHVGRAQRAQLRRRQLRPPGSPSALRHLRVGQVVDRRGIETRHLRRRELGDVQRVQVAGRPARSAASSSGPAPASSSAPPAAWSRSCPAPSSSDPSAGSTFSASSCVVVNDCTSVELQRAQSASPSARRPASPSASVTCVSVRLSIAVAFRPVTCARRKLVDVQRIERPPADSAFNCVVVSPCACVEVSASSCVVEKFSSAVVVRPFKLGRLQRLKLRRRERLHVGRAQRPELRRRQLRPPGRRQAPSPACRSGCRATPH